MTAGDHNVDASWVGRKFGPYRIVSLLGKGGMGEVYRARDERLERDVAIKALKRGSVAPDDSARARLLREARTASALNHPNICTVHEVAETGDQIYIVMELVEGQSLAAMLAAGKLGAGAVLRYGLQLADALSWAHEHGVIHRDLKSANVIVTPEGHLKVVDFGLAKRLESAPDLSEAITQSEFTLTLPGTLVGTPAYMSPEQWAGEPADARSDIWSLGVLLYEMAAGTRPFVAPTLSDLRTSVAREPHPPLGPSVPTSLRAMIDRCLEKEPERRYRQGGEARAALEAIASQNAGRSHTSSLSGLPLSGRGLVLLACSLLVIALLFAAWFGQRTSGFPGGAESIGSLAVLPLDNLAGEDYFADGMTQALITDLGSISALRVISRTSVMSYRDTDLSIPEIGRELRVDAVLEGSAMVDGDRVRVAAQLIEAETDRLLWSQSFEREYRDILDLQRDVAREIVDQIALSLTPEEASRLGRTSQVARQSYDAYLRGRYELGARTPTSIARALADFEEAVAIEPDSALAYAGLADALILAGSYGVLGPAESLPEARTAALRALDLDPTLAEAHTSLAALIADYYWDWEESERHFLTAIELNPSYALAHQWYSEYLQRVGRFDEAIESGRRAVDLDPRSPIVNASLALALYRAGRQDEAIAQARATLELEPNFAPAYMGLGLAYVEQALYEEALEALSRGYVASAEHPTFNGLLGYAYGLAGEREQAEAVLASLSEDPNATAVDLSVVYLGLGDHERTIDQLETGFENREWMLGMIRAEPTFDSIRAHPRFVELVSRMNLDD